MKPFLHLPFKKQKYQITEGWKYSAGESAIHGFSGHGGIDFKLPVGTEVLASADGWAVSSYFHFIVKNEDGSPKLYKGKEVGMGLGYFVQIYHPEQQLYTVYAHLSKTHPQIKTHRPRRVKDVHRPVGHKVPSALLPRYKYAVEVKKGDVIGYVGDSGLTWGYSDYPLRPSRKENPSWDEPHLHFEVCIRQGIRMGKKLIDPYGIKGEAKEYTDNYTKSIELRVKSEEKKENQKNVVLWVLGEDGLPEFIE